MLEGNFPSLSNNHHHLSYQFLFLQLSRKSLSVIIRQSWTNEAEDGTIFAFLVSTREEMGNKWALDAEMMGREGGGGNR